MDESLADVKNRLSQQFKAPLSIEADITNKSISSQRQHSLIQFECPVCKKSFVTRARAVQHGNNTRCKHATLNGECVENAPEEQMRLDHEMAVFRRNARRAGLSFFLACTMADGSA